MCAPLILVTRFSHGITTAACSPALKAQATRWVRRRRLVMCGSRHIASPKGPSGSKRNDGKEFVRSLDVAKGSAAPNLLGKFHDKTAIEVDRTGGPCDGNVYFAWARFTGNTTNGDNSSVYFVRSTNHGRTFSSPMKLSQSVHDIQFPDIAVTGDGHVYVTYRQFADVRGHSSLNA